MLAPRPRAPDSESTPMRTRPLHRSIAALIACTALALPVAPALAGPDDGKVVATRAHVDAPKTLWRDDSFALMNNNPVRSIPIGESVNWVGKGWDGYTGEENQYQFTVPETPSMAHMGEPGDIWYAAPATPAGNSDPTWTGYGADVGIPTEQFRDGAFFLDLLEVDGPGRVEMFNYPAFDYPKDVSNLLSSSREGWRSTPLTPGSHTHNTTAFSRPGRYELTYRTVARGTDGTLISSGPQTQVWQVGGAQPGEAPTPSTRERYDAAPTGDVRAAGYSLSLAPKQQITKDGDENLTTLTFDAGDEATSGTLTLFVNGYFLTDMPVSGGHAAWDELMGSASSQVQAVFTPNGDGTAPRWVSPALAYAPGAADRTTSAAGEGAWPEPIPDPANTRQSTEVYTPRSGDFTIRVAPDPDSPDFSRIDVEFADPRMRGFISGGMFAEPDDAGPTEVFASGITSGRATVRAQDDAWNEGATIRVIVTPHPTMNARAVTVDLPVTYHSGLEHIEQGALPLSPDGSGPSTPDQPTDPSGPDAPGSPEEPAPGTCRVDGHGDRVVLDEGHVDIATTMTAGGVEFVDGALELTAETFDLGISDETGIAADEAVLRDVEDVAFAVLDKDRRPRTAAPLDPALDVLGKEGSAVYSLPQSQLPGTLWPGYSTMGVDYEDLAGPVTLHLDPVSVPEGAQYAMYTQNLGAAEVLMDSAAGDTTTEIGFATHAHAAWAFTTPGVYVLDAYSTATTKDGRELDSGYGELVVLVGDEAVACGQGAEPGGGETGAGEDSDAEPKPGTDAADTDDSTPKDSTTEESAPGPTGYGAPSAGEPGPHTPASGEHDAGGADQRSGATPAAGTQHTSESASALARTGLEAAPLVAGALLLIGLGGLTVRRARSGHASNA